MNQLRHKDWRLNQKYFCKKSVEIDKTSFLQMSNSSPEISKIVGNTEVPLVILYLVNLLW